MKIKKQIILSAAIIIILGLYLAINSSGKINYKLPIFENLNEEIKIIEIKNPTETIKIFSDKNIWKFSSDNLLVGQSKVLEMISFLNEPKFIDMVSDSGSYLNYGLEEGQYTKVSVWTDIVDSVNPDRTIFLGSINSTGNFTYIRRSDNKNVFTVSGDLNSLFGLSRNDLLDKSITKFDIKKIEKITISSLKSNFVLTKSVGENNKDIWTSSNGTSIILKKLEQNLRYLSNSKFNAYIGDSEYSKPEFLFKIELIGENLNESLVIFQKLESEYLCKSTYTNKLFRLSENTGTQIIKMFNELEAIKE